MVLENSSALSSDEFSDGAPASDDDQYSISPKNPKSINIDTAKFPKPIPIIGPLFGFNDQLLSKLVNARIQRATEVLQRNVTAEEATAIAYWTAKNMSLISYGGPIGIAAGAWRAYSTANTFRLPFYQPNLEKFNGTVWPAARLSLLRGPRAVAAWHLCRLLAYGTLGNFFGKLFAINYGTSVMAVGEATDPRLKDYVQAFTNAAQTARGRLPNQPRQPGAVDGVQQKDASAQWRDHRREMEDDASPTSGAYGDTDPRSADIPVALENGISDQGSQMQDRRRGPSAQASDREGQPNGLGSDKQPLLFDDFDDASPTGGRDMENTGTAEGSAWDRIRQQAGTQPATSRRTAFPSGQTEQPSYPGNRARVRGRYHDQERPNPANRGDDRDDRDTFYRSEAERESAREKAQKEFDARVEQERRGGDFSGDNGEQKRW
jgi:hypothetical protein